MSYYQRINKLFKKAERIPIDHSSKIVIMSDCHRGDGDAADNFFKNQNIYYHALQRYYEQDFTYIELGDGDELWENKKFSDITNAHSNSLELIRQFYVKNRFGRL